MCQVVIQFAELTFFNVQHIQIEYSHEGWKQIHSLYDNNVLYAYVFLFV